MNQGTDPGNTFKLNVIFSITEGMEYCYLNDVFFVRVQCFFLALYVSTILFVEFF